MRKAFLPCEQEDLRKLRLWEFGQGKKLGLADRKVNQEQAEIEFLGMFQNICKSSS